MILAARPWICWPWHLRDLEPDQPASGADCRYCGREIAAPATRRPALACLYCGMDRGWIPLVEERDFRPLNP